MYAHTVVDGIVQSQASEINTHLMVHIASESQCEHVAVSFENGIKTSLILPQWTAVDLLHTFAQLPRQTRGLVVGKRWQGGTGSIAGQVLAIREWG